MTPSDKVPLARMLSQDEVFGEISPNDLQHLAEIAVQRTLRKREYLCYQGDVWPFVVYVHRGALQWALLSTGGRKHQLHTIVPHDVFWSPTFFDDGPVPVSLVASKASVVYLWSRTTLLPVLYRHPQALFGVAKKLTTTMRRARKIIYGLAFQPVASRLADFIVSSLEGAPVPILERNVTLDDIAAICASSPEVICRLLYQFQSEGIIKITRTSITVNDCAALKRLAAMD